MQWEDDDVKVVAEGKALVRLYWSRKDAFGNKYWEEVKEKESAGGNFNFRHICKYALHAILSNMQGNI